MKKKQFLVSSVLALGLILSSCGKKANNNPNGEITNGSSIEVIPVPNHSTKGLDLGVAKSFGVMAYVSISSAPTSNISGKVGLKPGLRSLITINPATEVDGGSVEIYAGDDVGDHQSYITMAREDLIAAYKDAAGRNPDKDKIEAYNGNPSGKILPAGVYSWSNGATLPTDVTLEGTDTDVWIFQINGDLTVSQNTRINLSAGAKARNVYWQVSGKVTLGSNSLTVGTIMNQQTMELKPNARVIGRIMSKNGKVFLSQNTISRSEI